MITRLTKRNVSVVGALIAPRLNHKAGDSPHWIPSKLSVTSAACTSGFIHARDLFDLMSSELGTSRASSPRVSLALQRSSRSRRRVETQAMSRRVSVSSSSSSVHSSSGWDDSSSMPSNFMSICGIDSAYSFRLFLWFRTYPTTGRSSQLRNHHHLTLVMAEFVSPIILCQTSHPFDLYPGHHARPQHHLIRVLPRHPRRSCRSPDVARSRYRKGSFG